MASYPETMDVCWTVKCLIVTPAAHLMLNNGRTTACLAKGSQKLTLH